MRKHPYNFIDLTGQRFGRWLVLKFANSVKGKTLWVCRCDCGIEKNIRINHLKSGASKSCGCLNKELASKREKGKKRSEESKRKQVKSMKRGKDSHLYKHGLCGTKAYDNMRSSKRRATKLNQTPDNANLQKIQLYYSICAYLNSNCEIPMWHVDHIRPISKGGLHHEDNLQILTAEINLQKFNKYPLTEEEEIKYKGIMI